MDPPSTPNAERPESRSWSCDLSAKCEHVRSSAKLRRDIYVYPADGSDCV
jgi:hypothetical protein